MISLSQNGRGSARKGSASRERTSKSKILGSNLRYGSGSGAWRTARKGSVLAAKLVETHRGKGSVLAAKAVKTHRGEGSVLAAKAMEHNVVAPGPHFSHGLSKRSPRLRCPWPTSRPPPLARPAHCSARTVACCCCCCCCYCCCWCCCYCPSGCQAAGAAPARPGHTAYTAAARR